MNRLHVLDSFCLDIDTIDEPHILKRARQKAKEKLFCSSLPKEVYPILEKTYRRSREQEEIHPPARENSLVFINGFFNEEHSHLSLLKQCVLVPFTKAARSYGPLLDSFYSSLLHNDKDPLLLLSLTSYQEGAFLYIPPHVQISHPIHVLYYTKTANLWTSPRLHVVMGHASSAHLVETYLNEGDNSLITPITTFDIGEEAKVMHTVTHQGQAARCSGMRASLKKNASLTSSSSLQGSFHRDTKRVLLQEEGSSVTLKGCLSGKEDDSFSSLVQVEHLAPHCQSSQLFKGVQWDRSRSFFDGTITIHQKAPLSKAEQYTHTLLLSEKAVASSRPSLEIYNDDVDVHHGATFGKMDKEALFYLRSRGIPAQEAEKLLIEGFLHV